jgi:hypothetical protein
MNTLFTIYYVLCHAGLVVWTLFVLIYGIRRKWEATPEGRNAFIVSVGLMLMFTILVTGIWWRLDLARAIFVLTTMTILVGGGIQRLCFLRKTRKKEEAKDGLLH